MTVSGGGVTMCLGPPLGRSSVSVKSSNVMYGHDVATTGSPVVLGAAASEGFGLGDSSDCLLSLLGGRFSSRMTNTTKTKTTKRSGKQHMWTRDLRLAEPFLIDTITWLGINRLYGPVLY